MSIRGLGMRKCGWNWGVADLNWARCSMRRLCEQRLRVVAASASDGGLSTLWSMVIATSVILEEVNATARIYHISDGPCTK